METDTASDTGIAPPLPLRPGERGVPLTPVDVTWLRMGDRSNLMHVNGALIVDGEVSREEAARAFGSRLARIPRFHQRVALDGSDFIWTEDTGFEILRHVVEEQLPEPGGDAELAATIGRSLGRPLDRRFPLWEFRLLQGYRGKDTVILVKIHHAIGDGVALMMVLLAMTDLDREGLAPNPFFDILTSGAGESIAGARGAAELWLPEFMKMMTAPADAFARASALLKGASATATIGKLLGRPSDPKTAFKGKLGVEKRVAWTPRMPLEEVRSLAKSLGGSINDVLNTAMAGGLRRYLARGGTPPESLAFRAAMPVNLRPLEELAALGNRFGLVFLPLPVGIEDPLARLAEMRRRSQALRRSAEPIVVLGLIDLAGRLPDAAQRLLVRIFGAKATAVFTNVPGPRQTIFFAGKPLRDVFFWVPQSGRLGLGVSILSYDGAVRMGVGTDAGLVPDPQRIVDGFDAEMQALASRAARG